MIPNQKLEAQGQNNSPDSGMILSISMPALVLALIFGIVAVLASKEQRKEIARNEAANPMDYGLDAGIGEADFEEIYPA